MKSFPLPPVLRGSLICLRRKCGKAHCHCARGQPHASSALSYSQGGQTKILTLPPAWLPQVRQALQRYHQGQRRWERQAETGLRRLAQLLRQARKSTSSR
jgi:hypothetical protein